MKRTTASYSVIAMLCSLVCLHAPASADSTFQLGAVEHVGLNRTSLANTRAALAEGNFTFRDEVLWSRVETEAGKLVFPSSLQDLDGLVSAVRQQGHRPLLVLDYGNRLYEPNGMITTPEGIAAFCRYARFIVQHFKGRVDQFEIWNEWNIGTGWTTRPRPKGPAEQYVNLLRAAYAAVKAENPAATVIGGVTEGVDIPWVQTFGKAGGFAYLDVFSVHPYVFWTVKPRPDAPRDLRTSQSLRQLYELAPALLARSAHAANSFTPVPSTPEDAMAKLDTLKANIDQFSPNRTISVYVTEMGWPTNAGQYGVSETTAAAYAQRFLLLARSRAWIGGVWWYDLFDDGSDPNEKEDRYGLLRQNGVPKPAFTAIAAVRDELLGAVTSSAVVTPAGQVTVQGQTASGKAFVAAWLATDDFLSTAPWEAGQSLLSSGYHSLAGQQGSPQLSATPYVLVKD